MVTKDNKCIAPYNACIHGQLWKDVLRMVLLDCHILAEILHERVIVLQVPHIYLFPLNIWWCSFWNSWNSFKTFKTFKTPKELYVQIYYTQICEFLFVCIFSFLSCTSTPTPYCQYVRHSSPAYTLPGPVVAVLIYLACEKKEEKTQLLLGYGWVGFWQLL